VGLPLRWRALSRIAKPRPLFTHLVGRLAPALVLDVGSRDGSDALAFRAASPASRILCFEANPRLYAGMRADPRLSEAGIEIFPFAVSDSTGEARFRIFNAEKGMGSLLPRVDAPDAETFAVPTRRLDDLPEARGAGGVALWVDVEGCSYQVVEGAKGLLDRVVVIHAEVETRAFWAEQRLAGDLSRMLAGHGFSPVLVRMKRRTPEQGNAIFLREELARRPATWASLAVSSLAQALRP
jgi:FkbM family methyltransferase